MRLAVQVDDDSGGPQPVDHAPASPVLSPLVQRQLRMVRSRRASLRAISASSESEMLAEEQGEVDEAAPAAAEA